MTSSKLKLSAAQKATLAIAANNHGEVSGGRYGLSVSTLKALESRGLVELVTKSLWDSEWRLTQKGQSTLEIEENE